MLGVLDVYISQNNSWSRLFFIIGQLLIFLIIFLFVIILSIYITKYICSMRSIKNKNIKFLEVLSVGYQSNIQLLKVCDRYILIGVTKNNISFLLDLTESSSNIEKLDEKNGEFRNYIEKYFNKVSKSYKDENGDKHD